MTAAVAVLLWPLHANGVEGSALMPRYSEYFGFAAYGVLPEHPTDADLRRAGVRLPQDVVWHRRHIVFGLLASAVGVIVAGGALVIVERRRSSRRP